MDAGHPIDLLIVDDDEDFSGRLCRRFRRRSFQVQDAASGEQALERVERRRFDVAIVDMVMPGMSGLDLLAKLRAVQPDCQVILLTGQGTIETAVEAMKLGATISCASHFRWTNLKLSHSEPASAGICKRKMNNSRPSSAAAAPRTR